jgi:hypothetical protein
MITDVEFPAIRRPELDADDILPCGAESAFVALCRTGTASNRIGYFRVQCNIDFWTLRISILSIYPSMALQPLPGLGLPHKMPPFISICCSSPPSSIYWFRRRHLWGFLNISFFSGVGSLPPRPTPNLEDQGDPASSYATAGLALSIIWPHKPHHYVKVETPSGGMCICYQTENSVTSY